MTSPAEPDVNDDSDVTNDETDEPWSVTLGDVQYFPAPETSRYEFLRFDPKSDIPLFSDATSIGKLLATFDEKDSTELGELITLIGGLGHNLFDVVFDPMNALLAAGLGFLVDVVQPFEDLVGLVTGNGERMATEISRWERVGRALVPLAEEVRKCGEDHMFGWRGLTAERSRERLDAFANGMRAVATDIKLIEVCLILAKTVMDIAQAVLIQLLATWVEWLIITWMIAMDAAPETAGASVNVAVVATEVEGGVMLSRGVVFLDRVVPVLGRLENMFKKLEPMKMAGVREGYAPKGAQRSAGSVRDEYVRSDDTWMPAATKGAGGAVSVEQRYQDWLTDEHRQSSGDIDRELDKDG
ncbi:hypothetical protein Lfu02_48040 [Longispora fulva]|uniref:ESX-1 secretion-associated protein EspA/EspE-like domain-containing protein n=1 Tax=Longispora fulva TaxID=619741 RepID=A0A8J7KH77_9ACTN|nr:hypothetical protein [Longispora fulva]MBG6138180.1 hypothetical protein [Longispora fulva]GIG60432.1 hypothetical protein Lfu02_48040 [Longispora fulva]